MEAGKALAAAKQPAAQIAEPLTPPDSSLGSSSGQRLWRAEVNPHPALLPELPILINGQLMGQEGMKKQCLLTLEA